VLLLAYLDAAIEKGRNLLRRKFDLLSDHLRVNCWGEAADNGKPPQPFPGRGSCVVTFLVQYFVADIPQVNTVGSLDL